MSETQQPVVGLYAQFQTDPDIEKAGIELEYHLGKGPDKKPRIAVIRIARAGGGNTRYNKVLEFRTKPYRRQIQTETIDPDTFQTIMREVYADAVVLAWSGVTDAAGNELPFLRDNVVKLFEDLPDLFADIQTSAQKVALFRKQQLDDVSGNS